MGGRISHSASARSQRGVLLESEVQQLRTTLRNLREVEPASRRRAIESRVESLLSDLTGTVRSLISGRLSPVSFRPRLGPKRKPGHKRKRGHKRRIQIGRPLDFEDSGEADLQLQQSINRRLRKNYDFDVAVLDRYWITRIGPRLALLFDEKRTVHEAELADMCKPLVKTVVAGYGRLESWASAESVSLPDGLREAFGQLVSALDRPRRASAEPGWRVEVRRAKTQAMNAVKEGAAPRPVRLDAIHEPEMRLHFPDLEAAINRVEQTLNPALVESRTLADVWAVFDSAEKAIAGVFDRFLMDQGLDVDSKGRRRQKAGVGRDVSPGGASLDSSSELTVFYAFVVTTLRRAVRNRREQQYRLASKAQANLAPYDHKRPAEHGALTEAAELSVEYLRSRLPSLASKLTVKQLLSRTNRLRPSR